MKTLLVFLLMCAAPILMIFLIASELVSSGLFGHIKAPLWGFVFFYAFRFALHPRLAQRPDILAAERANRPTDE